MGGILTELSSLFTERSVAAYLKTLNPLETTIMDSIYSDRPLHHLPVVTRDLFTETAHALPYVMRGGASVSITQGSGNLAGFEPLSARPNVEITAKDANDLKMIGKSGREEWAKNQTDILRRRCRATAEAICALSLGGSLAWPIKLEGGGWESYQVTYGTNLSVTPSKLWDASGAKIMDAYALLQEMEDAIKANGYGSKIKIMAGKTAYSTLLSLAESVTSTAKIKITIDKEGIDIAGYKVEKMAEKYVSPENNTAYAKLGDKSVRMVAIDGGFRMPYCAVDDLSANLKATPFFIKTVIKEDPSKLLLIAESKPFPIDNPNAVCDATVLS